MQTACTVSGKKVQLSSQDVESRMKDIIPEPARSLVVEVNGQLYPVKQALAIVTGLDRADFISHQARSIFLRLGFEVTRLTKTA
jgi:hypothetical protein